MQPPTSYELVFETLGDEDDTVVVGLTERTGAGGSPIYEDETGIVRAEISVGGEARMLMSGGHQAPRTVKRVRPLPHPGTPSA
ncbi:DUF6296 family protein [Streptomyces sp. NBC_01218]|uniref:DUF6296 family protein n=1 Tax=unclassified Streptomyces TaxID=2593676 RepID=UPI0023B91F63|nr:MULTISPECIES: DUF6296 family protein [unclassified Streptomyces]WEH38275.1 DUF6296 family protein [Streptomyces sp. AM 2-1-1]WSQ49936.1 DUF6296 family protein [Streptomyces sp. NBC_01218]